MNKSIFVFFLLCMIFNSLLTAREITFSGMTWTVKNTYGGPGPNYWSDSSDNVWVDTNGKLHLKIRKIGDDWYCSEIYLNQSLGYGEYLFYVSSNVEDYDQNIVVGLFTYETDTKEIDIEFSKWGDPNRINTGQYVIQPFLTSGNIERFELNLTGNYSSHKFMWHQDDIFFQSYHGHYKDLPGQSYLIHEWTYTGNDNPPVGNERLHINFWLQNGNAPSDSLDAELIIDSVTFTKDEPLSVTLNSFISIFSNNISIIRWTTSSETNNSYWNLYRSPSLNLGQAIMINKEKINGQGTTSEPKYYSYHDKFNFEYNASYFYWIESINYMGKSTLFGPIKLYIPYDNNSDLPQSPLLYELKANYPNPFNPSTSISFQLKENSKVRLEIFNSKGEKIQTLYNGFVGAGQKITKIWNATSFSSGIYFYKLITKDEKITRKMLLLK